MTPRLRYEGGTLTLEPLPDLSGPWQDLLTWDDRSESPRALGMHYRTLLESLRFRQADWDLMGAGRANVKK